MDVKAEKYFNLAEAKQQRVMGLNPQTMQMPSGDAKKTQPKGGDFGGQNAATGNDPKRKGHNRSANSLIDELSSSSDSSSELNRHKRRQAQLH